MRFMIVSRALSRRSPLPWLIEMAEAATEMLELQQSDEQLALRLHAERALHLMRHAAESFARLCTEAAAWAFGAWRLATAGRRKLRRVLG